MRDAPDLVDLLGRVTDGDQQAFADLYDATSTRAFGLVLRVVRDRAQAEEVTQEVFLQVWRGASSFRADRGSVLSWVLTLAHRRAVDRVRTAQAQSDRDVVYESRRETPAYDSTAEGVVERWQATQVRGAIAELRERQREAIELAYFGGLTHREVSERLDVPLGTAKTRIRDGLRAMRKQMGGEAG